MGYGWILGLLGPVLPSYHRRHCEPRYGSSKDPLNRFTAVYKLMRAVYITHHYMLMFNLAERWSKSSYRWSFNSTTIQSPGAYPEEEFFTLQDLHCSLLLLPGMGALVDSYHALHIPNRLSWVLHKGLALTHDTFLSWDGWMQLLPPSSLG